MVMALLMAVSFFLAGARFGQREPFPTLPSSGRKILYYVDPMNPTHTSMRPGVAPCGMKMEPVYANEGTAADPPMAAGTLHLSQEKQQLIGVRVGLAETVTIAHTLRWLGRVVPDDRLVYRIHAGIDGFVRDVSTITVGSKVQKDQWLASFAAPDARTTIQGFLTAVDILERQKKIGPDNPAPIHILNENCRIASERLQNLGLSHIQIEEIRRTREIPNAFSILAPADGFVLAQNVAPGLKFEKGAEWYRIADLSRVWILTDVHYDEAEYIQPGAIAQVWPAGQRKPLSANASDVLPQFDPVTKTHKVRLEVENPEIQLRPEMLVNVEIPLTLAPMLMAPAEAVLCTGLNTTLFIACGNGYFEPRTVEIGRRVGDRVEIVKGLQPGERIVLSGTFLLDSESRMKQAASSSSNLMDRDPVCGMSVAAEPGREERRHSTYQGKNYYFCADACKQQFDQNPEDYLHKRDQPDLGGAGLPVSGAAVKP